jgi:hypothetical protein
MTCPWVHEHSDELDTAAAYFEPDELYPVGGFAVSTPTATSTISGRCWNFLASAAQKHGTSRSSAWWGVTCTAWWMRLKRSWRIVGGIIRQAV